MNWVLKAKYQQLKITNISSSKLHELGPTVIYHQLKYLHELGPKEHISPAQIFHELGPNDHI